MIVEARRATVAHGLHGFTIEQLCETVGVSRRTFFNHFASKDDAVLGIEHGASEAMLHGYATGGVVPSGLDPLASVVALAVEQVRVVGLDRTEQDLARQVFEREPAMVPKFLAVVDEQLAAVARAVRARFGWDDPDDRRAQLVAETAGVLLKVTMATAFDDAHDDGSGPPFDVLIAENLRQLRAAVTTTGQDPTA